MLWAGFFLLLDTPSFADLVPVQTKVTSSESHSVQTITVCNTSDHSIPLTKVEFNFDYEGSLDIADTQGNIWGQPYLNWKLETQTKNHAVLTGGSQWVDPLPPDPSCKNPLTIMFLVTPDFKPRAPFNFKAQGGHPIGQGVIKITMPNAPADHLSTPKFTIQGMGQNITQSATWGQHTQIILTPGDYTVTASVVDNGTEFFKAQPVNVTVKDQVNSSVSIVYQNVPTSKISVSLNNAPDTKQTITLKGSNYVFNPVVTNNAQITLPQDVYTVSASLPGYTVSATPNPLHIPSDTQLKLDYQPTTITTMPRFSGYYQSWSSQWVSDGSKSDLANLPSYANVVILSFMRPDATYAKGSFNTTTTGLEFSYDGTVLKQAINTLHQKHPNTKILVAVGGSAYTNWNQFNPKAISDFVTDFGLDGVDVDYEPTTPGCNLGNDQLIHCAIDSAFQSYIQGLRALLPKPYWITLAGWSIGAYGQDQWINAQPKGDFTGIELPLFRSIAGQEIDMVHVMSYDAGTTYNPSEALTAYTHYFRGPISMGVQVPPEAWGGHVYTLEEVIALAKSVIATASEQHKPAAMMLWSLQKKPNGTASPTNPNAQMIATTICNELGLTGCSDPLGKMTAVC
jgi:chitinase